MKLKYLLMIVGAVALMTIGQMAMAQEAELRKPEDCMSKSDRARIAAKYGFKLMSTTTIENGEILTMWRHVENGNLIFTVMIEGKSCVVAVGVSPEKEY